MHVLGDTLSRALQAKLSSIVVLGANLDEIITPHEHDEFYGPI